jgi:hypothetical protein
MILTRQFVVAMGITILFPLLVHYGVGLIEPHPDIQRHYMVWVRITPTTPEGWKAWEEENRAREQREKEARDAIDRATQPFFRLLILVAAPLGIAAIAAGLFLRSVSVGTGPIFGGMFAAADGIPAIGITSTFGRALCRSRPPFALYRLLDIDTSTPDEIRQPKARQNSFNPGGSGRPPVSACMRSCNTLCSLRWPSAAAATMRS